MADNETNNHPHTDSPRRRRSLLKPLPAEGEGGVFTQSWYPVCLSSEIPAGSLVGKGFLGGRVVAFRGESGVAQVLSAYCPHLGADLSIGCVIEDHVQCAFHHWRFDREGTCAQTASGDPPPHNALLFKYPTVERYGIVWAFNGDEPLFSLPDMPYPEEELTFKPIIYNVLDYDPYVLLANTPDIQHLRVVHGMAFDEDPTDRIEWTDHSFGYPVRATIPGGERMDFHVSVYGTNIFRQLGTINGQWFCVVQALCVTEPGRSTNFISLAVRNADVDEVSREATLDGLIALETALFEQDVVTLKGIHFKPGVMSRSDRALVRYFGYVRNFPRANPGADFIR